MLRKIQSHWTVKCRSNSATESCNEM